MLVLCLPAVLMQAYRWIADSRDQFSKERLRALDDEFKVRAFAAFWNADLRSRAHGGQFPSAATPLGWRPMIYGAPVFAYPDVCSNVPFLRAAVPLPPDHELHQDVPEGLEPCARHRQDLQGDAPGVRVIPAGLHTVQCWGAACSACSRTVTS